jgi:glycosyltransferase involved in cell wall biosynthesis
MRILFLCSCLEPSRDGVGDYTRSLAGECVRQGHSCAIIALHDHFIANSMESVDDAGTQKIPVLRLPAKLTWRERMEQAVAFRSHFQPDWISLQFVPYGFNDKGIVLNLARAFRTLTADHRLHLMLHEIWIGQTPAAPLRQHLIGFFQRLGIKRLLSSLQPQLVTTSNAAYRSILKNAGISAALLPLFGNIPVVASDSKPELPIALMNERDHWWLGIFFGALHPEWEPEPFLSILKQAAFRANKRICLLLAGRPGATGEALWEKLKQAYPSDLVFIESGELPAEKISVLLQSADFGIAASPWQLVGKSGTIAAMLDHGLPVIVTRDDFQPRPLPDEPPSTDPLLHRCDDALEAKLRAGLPKRSAHSHLGEITAQFCRLLQANP